MDVIDDGFTIFRLILCRGINSVNFRLPIYKIILKLSQFHNFLLLDLLATFNRNKLRIIIYFKPPLPQTITASNIHPRYKSQSIIFFDDIQHRDTLYTRQLFILYPALNTLRFILLQFFGLDLLQFGLWFFWLRFGISLILAEVVDELSELLGGIGYFGQPWRLLQTYILHHIKFIKLWGLDQFINFWISYIIISNHMIFKIFVSILVAVLVNQACTSECSSDADQFLVSFHPHLDAFWLNTDDELKNINFTPAGFLYAMNQRNSKTILNSMYDALTKKSTRKYFVTEIVFFKDWYEYISQGKRKEVKKLIENGQLELPNGGWVQNDEAVCYFDDILDQYTIGHNFMYTQFGVETKIGWATDSFGHSHSQVALEHLLGFEFQGIERIDDRYIYDRNGGHLLQFYWSAVSDSNNRKYGGVLNYVRHFLHEVNDFRRQSPSSIAADFRELEKNMAKLYNNKKRFRFLGNDFQEFITPEFQNLQQTFDMLNQGKSTACPQYKYGNPSDYLELVKKTYSDVPQRKFDFMPNYDQDHYWSGYYTTDPDLKKICKDFSRLVNIYRKLFVKYAKDSPAIQIYRKTLIQADELLSIMQHHDGITATSKGHIEQLFKDRMTIKSEAILKHIVQIKGLPSKLCNLYKGGNICVLSEADETVYFTILHEGSPKKERVEVLIPQFIAYDVQDDETDNVICNPALNVCYLVFEPSLVSGQNIFVFKKIDKEKSIPAVLFQGNFYQSDGFKIAVQGNKIRYTLINQNEEIIISLARSANRQTNARTYTWNKYGQRIEKNENRMPGIYIMANEGNISELNLQSASIQVAKGILFTKIFLSTKAYSFVITIKNKEKNIIDLQTNFMPQSRQMYDYFLKIQSTVKGNADFYHDMNGYLVSKRDIGMRPDYTWQYRQDDKINANTYPMCSFAYVLQGNKKMVVFTDRAQGVTKYDNALLINIDRLASDDYKGVGEGYFNAVRNSFRHRIGIVSKDSYVEREWQKNFDDALLAFYSSTARSTTSTTNIIPKNSSKYLKYTVFVLNPQEYVLRLMNLGEQQDIDIPLHIAKQWSIPQLSLNLYFQDIKESFANGIPLGERKSWVNITEEINIFNAGSKDNLAEIVLSPLQIRSFRINTKGTITASHQTPQQQQEKSPLATPKLKDPKPVSAKFTKRCF